MRTGAKTMRKVTLLLAAMALAVVLAALPAQAATTFTVNSTNDAPDTNAGDEVCDSNSAEEGNQCTLRAAIQEANALSGDDVIGFDPPVSGTITLGGTHLLIGSNLKIEGPGADELSVNANSQSRVFNVQGGTVDYERFSAELVAIYWIWVLYDLAWTFALWRLNS
jgi:CSLREA domain-containing protein